MDAIAIDFETANELRNSACAVGLAWIALGRVVRRETRLIRPPDLRFSPGNIRVHGILPADVRDKPNLPDVMAEFLPDLSNRLVLAHNASFDMGVLSASLAAWGHPLAPIRSLCTLRVARQVFPDPAGCGLARVAGRLGIRFEHHDSGEDAYACAEIALAAMHESGASSVSDLPRVLGLTVQTTSVAGPAAHRTGRDGLESLRFVVRGSTGRHYVVVLEDRRFEPYLRCDCAAGRHGRRCRHVEALVEGDVTDLRSDNLDDVERLRVRLTATGSRVEPSRPMSLGALRRTVGWT